MTGKNILLALLVSFVLTFSLANIYIFYPLIILMLTDREGAGIGATGGSLSVFFIIAPLLFIVIFAILQRRSKKKLNL
jgi:hypothetical protein